MLVCIGHRPITFKGLRTRTGEMHTKATGPGVMFHLSLPAKSGKKHFACFTTHLLYISLEVQVPWRGGYKGRAAKVVDKRRVLYGPCYSGKWKGEHGDLKPVCAGGKGSARGDV